MKIVVVGKFYIEGFALHIAETLASMGHSAFQVEPGQKSLPLSGRVGHRLNQALDLIYHTSGGIPQLRAGRSKKFISQIAALSPNLVIVCHDYLTPDEVSKIKKIIDAPIVMWFPDSMANFGRAYFMNAPYDALFFKDPYLVRVMRGILKSPVYYLPECCNPLQHVLRSGDHAWFEEKYPEAIDIAIAGNQHSWRVAYFSHLTEFNVKIWGNPPPLWMPDNVMNKMYQGYGVFNHEKAFIFNRAKINVNNLLYSEIEGVNARCFEVAAAAGFQLIDFRPSLADIFVVEKELVTYSGIQDLKDKIKYWLPRREERVEIGRASYEKVIARHTYNHRLSEILSVVF